MPNLLNRNNLKNGTFQFKKGKNIKHVEDKKRKEHHEYLADRPNSEELDLQKIVMDM